MLRIRTAAVATALSLASVACSRRADSGRADSARATETAAAAPSASTTSADSARRTPAPGNLPDTGNDSTPKKKGAATPAKPTASKPATTPRPPAPSGAAAPAAPATPPAKAPAASEAAGGAAAAAPAAGAAATGEAPANGGAVRVNRFMSYDAANKSVDLSVIAAFDHTMGGFNFNGGSNGAHVITVPVGWSVSMDVKNVDAIPHSAIVIRQQKPLPNAPDSPDISRAYTSHVNDGLPPVNGEDQVNFRASKAGDYWIYCGVPGHGPSGMYISFIVSADATAPSYKM